MHIILHACTMIIVHACPMIIIYACTMIIVHACTMIIVHACTMTIVHASCPTGFMFDEIEGGESGGRSPLPKHVGFWVRRPPRRGGETEAFGWFISIDCDRYITHLVVSFAALSLVKIKRANLNPYIDYFVVSLEGCFVQKAMLWSTKGGPRGGLFKFLGKIIHWVCRG